MEEQKLQQYRSRVEQATQSADRASSALLGELLQELEQLQKDNDRLRLTLIKSSRKTSMSSKLKDALYE